MHCGLAHFMYVGHMRLCQKESTDVGYGDLWCCARYVDEHPADSSTVGNLAKWQMANPCLNTSSVLSAVLQLLQEVLQPTFLIQRRCVFLMTVLLRCHRSTCLPLCCDDVPSLSLPLKMLSVVNIPSLASKEPAKATDARHFFLQ